MVVVVCRQSLLEGRGLQAHAGRPFALAEESCLGPAGRRYRADLARWPVSTRGSASAGASSWCWCAPPSALRRGSRVVVGRL